MYEVKAKIVSLSSGIVAEDIWAEFNEDGLPEDAETIAQKYLKEHGLDKVTGLPDKTIKALKSSLIRNYNNKGAYFRRAFQLGVSQDQAEIIFENEKDEANAWGEMGAAKNSGAESKTWMATFENTCQDCAAMDGETVPIDEPFSNGDWIPHFHPNCQCHAIFHYFNEDSMKQNEMSQGDLLRAIRSAIMSEYEAIQLYTSLSDTIQDEIIKAVLIDITNEEKVHVGEFQALLRMLDPVESANYAEGDKEVSDIIQKLR